MASSLFYIDSITKPTACFQDSAVCPIELVLDGWVSFILCRDLNLTIDKAQEDTQT